MSIDLILGAAAFVGLLAYLLYALARTEHF